MQDAQLRLVSRAYTWIRNPDRARLLHAWKPCEWLQMPQSQLGRMLTGTAVAEVQVQSSGRAVRLLLGRSHYRTSE